MNRQQRRALAKTGARQPQLRPGNSTFTDSLLQSAARFSIEGKLAQAAAQYRRLLAIDPRHAVAHACLGGVLADLKEYKAAEEHLRKAIELEPRFADGYANLSYLMLQLGRYEEAEELGRQAIALDPRHVNGWINLATAVKARGRLGEARECFLNATRLAPQRGVAWRCLGHTYLAEQEFERARECYQRAIALDENDADAHGGLGAVLCSTRGTSRGILSLARAISLNPRNTKALMNLGAALYMQSHAELAKQAYRQAIAVAPDNHGAKVKLAASMPLMMRSTEENQRWQVRATEELKALLADPSMRLLDPFLQVNFTNFHGGYYGLNDREMNRTLAQVYLKACPALDWTAPHCAHWRRGRKLRVGVVTAFAISHIVGELFRAIEELFDPERFEVIPFSPAFSTRAPTAAARARRSVALPPVLFEARKLIAAAQPDVMFYLDTFVHPFLYFLGFARLAPVQCTTWGHPVTTGIPNMDYFISARDWEAEDADAHYTEKLVRLGELPMYFGPPPIPDTPVDRARYGIPPDAKVYTCLQSLFKLHPDFDHALAGLLRRDPKGVIVLLTGDHASWNQIFAERFNGKFADVTNRIVFIRKLPRREYLAFLKQSDAVLDPFHWGGGNTTIEALAAGVPVPTLPAAYLRGRLTLGFYRKMEMPELIADSAKEFVELNYRLANDEAIRAAFKRKVEERLPRLYNNVAAIRELERFFEEACEAAATGGSARPGQDGASVPAESAF